MNQISLIEELTKINGRGSDPLPFNVMGSDPVTFNSRNSFFLQSAFMVSW